uniref:NACHT domain-containing protein n=1 Tax=Agathobacter sp. TaxID=2021311 RepID=UPI0040579503
MDNQMPQVHAGSGDNVRGDKYVIHINTAPPIEMKPEELSRKRNEYCKYASQEYTCLPIIENEKILDIEKIYVTLVLTHGNLTREKVFVDTSGVSFGSTIEAIELQRDLGSPQRMESGDVISLRNVLLYKKVVILGEPGIGKSTLLKKLFIDICNKKCYPDFLPIYVPLSGVKIEDMDFVHDYVNQKYKTLDGTLEHFVKYGHAFFLFDGLDEISYREQQMVSSVSDLFAARGNRVFVTCRTAVFPRALLSSDFKLFECIGFNAAQRRKFLRLWFEDDLNLATLIENEIVNHLGTAGISRNPLLLSLIAMHFEENKSFKLPKKRIAIYLESIQLLLARREAKNIWNIPAESRIELLEYIAYEMSDHNIDVIFEKDLKEMIHVWKQGNRETVFGQYDVDTVIKIIVEMDGIIHRCSKTQFRFLHLVLQESLTASYLSRQQNWFEVFESKIFLPRWEETLRLTVSLVTKERAKRERISKYLYEIFEREPDCLFLAGRYMSDFDSSDSCEFFLIFDKILHYVTEEHPLNHNDAVVSLASICNAHSTYRDYLLSYFKQELKKSYQFLYIYIRLLKLIPSKVSKKEILQLIKKFETEDLRREGAIHVIGVLVQALDYYYDFNFWKNLYVKYMNSQNSHLSGIIAEALSNIQISEMCVFLEHEIKKGNAYNNCLIYYIIQKYEDEELGKRFLLNAIKTHDICIQQTFSDKYRIEADGILDFIKEEKDEISQAILINAGFYFQTSQDSDFLENIVFNEKAALILRCSALEAYLLANRNNKKRLKHIVAFFSQNQVPTDLKLVCVNNLTKLESSLLSDYFFECDEELEEKVIYSLTGLLSMNVMEGAGFWLQGVLERFDFGTPIYAYAVLALAKQGFPNIARYIQCEAEQYSKMGLREKVLLIKVLAVSNSKNRGEQLIKFLDLETDINIASLIIENMGTIREKDVQETLLRYLDASQWPKSWPQPYPEPKEGEQRPTDRRMVMVILALNQLGSHEAIPVLQKIYEDASQADDVRRTAHIVYKNLKWESNIHKSKQRCCTRADSVTFTSTCEQ